MTEIKYTFKNLSSWSNQYGHINIDLKETNAMTKLTDDEYIKYLTNVLTHEHIHIAIFKITDNKTSQLFDLIAHKRGIQLYGINKIIKKCNMHRRTKQEILRQYHINTDKMTK